jgi:hypothetical protein
MASGGLDGMMVAVGLVVWEYGCGKSPRNGRVSGKREALNDTLV